tara:strand:+ start:6658 stop:7449 length:792 start_codon:yes stop_codon:yes gene_type:complete
MEEKTIKQLNKLSEAMKGDSVQVDELKEVMDLLFNLIAEMKKRLDDEISKGDNASMQKFNQVMSEMSDLDSRMKKMSNTDNLDKAIKGLMSEIKVIKDTMPKMSNLSVYEAKLSQIEASIPAIKDMEEETPQETRDKLESIQRESEKLGIDAIGYLREELDKINKKISKSKGITIFGGGSSSGGRIVKSYDIFSQLNGVLKTFTLPSFYRIISVHASSFPFSFRDTVDYTTDASAMTITFTSEITASSTLATGQTITIVYSEA